MNIKNCLRTATLAAAALAGPAFAGVVFSDNFDSDRSSSALNFDSLLNWDVSEGTIDYIRNGGWGINCAGNSGGCLDMDGSTGNAGRITSKQSFSFASGTQPSSPLPARRHQIQPFSGRRPSSGWPGSTSSSCAE